MDEHDLIVAVKELALELGQTPTVTQCRKHIKNYQANLENSQFRGNQTAIIDVAGLAPTRPGKKINNSVFETNIERHLSSYEPISRKEREPYPSILVISDIHWPFHNENVVNRFLECVGDTKPDHVILNGDAFDFYSHSRFPRSHNVFTPREEEALARKGNEEFWDEVLKRSPKSICTQMMGNHDVRPMKKVLEAYPEAEDWIKEKLKNLFTFPGVKTIMDQREELMLPGDIAVFHGYRSKLGDHRDYTLFNCINGHTHLGGVVFRRIRGNTIWELNSGLAGDPEAKGLTYTPQKIVSWTPGFGEVDKKGPRFISV